MSALDDPLYHAVINLQARVNDPLTRAGNSGWAVSGPPASAAFRDAAYHVGIDGTTSMINERWAQALTFGVGSTATSVFATQVTVGLTLDPDSPSLGGGGLILGPGPGAEQHHLRFVVRKDGFWNLVNSVTNEERAQGWAQPAERYTLTAITYGGSTSLYVDSGSIPSGSFPVLVGRALLESGMSPGGMVGVFAVNSGKQPVDAAFSNFKVWADSVKPMGTQ